MSGDSNSNLVVTPATELKFKGPFTSVVTSHLYLKNVSSKVMCYKVKTTAPKMYCVRPNSGLIDSGKEVDISIMLQPFDYNPSENLKHKFLIQSTLIDEKISENIDQIWKAVDKEDITEIKLKCLFECDPTATENRAGGGESATGNISNNAQPGLSHSVDDMKKELETLKQENSRLKENEVRLRKLALEDSVEKSQLPPVADHSKQSSFDNSMVLLLFLCLISFIIGLIIAKFVL